MKKFKSFFAILVAFMVMFSGFGYAKAASVVNEGNILDDNNEPFFKAKDAAYTVEYIWAKLRTSDGDVAYCLDFGKSWPDSGTGLDYRDTIDPADAGLIYIIEHGANDYRNPTNQERYVTQGAIWLYVTNSNTFSRPFNDPYGLLARMNELVSDAKRAKTSGNVNGGTIDDITGNSDMLLSENGKYYESSLITPTVRGVSTYTVSLSGSSDAQIVSNSGEAKTTFNAGEGFKVRVSSTLGAGVSVGVNVSIKTKAYVLSPNVNGNYQRVISLGNAEKTISKSLNLRTVDTVCVDYKIVGDVIPDPNLTDPTPGKNCVIKGSNYTQENKLTTRTDCTFKGWFLNENLSGSWTDGDALNNDMTLYGAWDCPEKVTVPPTAASTPLIILGSGLAIVAGGFGYYIFKVKKA